MCCSFMTNMYFTIGSKHATCNVEESQHKDFMHPLSSWIYRICTFTLFQSSEIEDQHVAAGNDTWKKLSCIILCRMHKKCNTWKEFDNVIACIRTLMSHSLSSWIYRMNKISVLGFFNITNCMFQANGEMHIICSINKITITFVDSISNTIIFLILLLNFVLD